MSNRPLVERHLCEAGRYSALILAEAAAMNMVSRSWLEMVAILDVRSKQIVVS
jgi:hypothetical protein